MELYFILGIIAMIGYGVTAIIYKLASPSIDSVSLTLVVSCFMTFTIFLFWVFYRQKYIAMKGFEYSAIAGVIAGLAFIAFVSSVTLGKISVATTLRGLSFLITTIIAVLFLAEKISFTQGLGVVFGAVAVVLIGL
ncbi:MAG: EamA family transporter [Candidatus Aenigmarchaeota archaeon]|nr:EamA family transporter [Candidatus Aenigmarchaeota archaeon]